MPLLPFTGRLPELLCQVFLGRPMGTNQVLPLSCYNASFVCEGIHSVSYNLRKYKQDIRTEQKIASGLALCHDNFCILATVEYFCQTSLLAAKFKYIYIYSIYIYKLLYVITINHVGHKRRRQMPQGSRTLTRSHLWCLTIDKPFLLAFPKLQVLKYLFSSDL